MPKIIREYEVDGYLIQEYESGAIVRSAIPGEPIPVPNTPTIEEKILAENQYQTMLLELTSMGGM